MHDVTELIPRIQQGTLGDRGVVFVKGGYIESVRVQTRRPESVRAGASSWATTITRAIPIRRSRKPSSPSSSTLSPRANTGTTRLILITWDDSEGFYDHASPPNFERCPDGHPCGDGPRVPAIIISPFARDHAIDHDLADHTSFAKMISKIFDTPPLATLPDEAPYLPEGPRDTNPALSDLLSALDPERLSARKNPFRPVPRLSMTSASRRRCRAPRSEFVRMWCPAKITPPPVLRRLPSEQSRRHCAPSRWQQDEDR